VYQLQCFSYHHDNMQGREMEKDVWTLKFRSWTLVQCSAVACDQPCMQRKNKTPGYYPSSIDLLLYCIRIDRDVPREECQMEQGDGPKTSNALLLPEGIRHAYSHGSMIADRRGA
jgi:hypothetical protein